MLGETVSSSGRCDRGVRGALGRQRGAVGVGRRADRTLPALRYVVGAGARSVSAATGRRRARRLPVVIELLARRFKWVYDRCPAVTFAEQVEPLAGPYAPRATAAPAPDPPCRGGVASWRRSCARAGRWPGSAGRLSGHAASCPTPPGVPGCGDIGRGSGTGCGAAVWGGSPNEGQFRAPSARVREAPELTTERCTSTPASDHRSTDELGRDGPVEAAARAGLT